MSLMLAICFINGSNASITSASRLLYAMARDRGIIFHGYFSHISPGLNVPMRTIAVCYVFNVCFGLLYLGPVVAFSAYVASCVVFLNMSYAAPIIVLAIRGRSVLRKSQTATPFKMSGVLGWVVNVVAILYLVVTSVVSTVDATHYCKLYLTKSTQFFCFPTSLPVSTDSMSKFISTRLLKLMINESADYISAVIGIFAVLVTLYWLIYGKAFLGPVSTCALDLLRKYRR